MRKKKFVIMDNREKECEKEHIAGTVSFSIDDLLKDPKKLTNAVGVKFLSSIAMA